MDPPSFHDTVIQEHVPDNIVILCVSEKWLTESRHTKREASNKRVALTACHVWGGKKGEEARGSFGNLDNLHQHFVTTRGYSSVQSFSVLLLFLCL